jgi:hypothetical protein
MKALNSVSLKKKDFNNDIRDHRETSVSLMRAESVVNPSEQLSLLGVYWW